MTDTDRRISPEDYTTLVQNPVATAAFLIAQRRAEMQGKVQSLCIHLQGILQGAGYFGPVAIAGGYLRDVAIGKDTPKDLDVFLDSGYIREQGVSVRGLAAVVGSLLGVLEKVHVIPCYGDWASDIEMVAKATITADDPLGAGLPAPSSVDIVVLRREEMVKFGYEPTAEDNPYELQRQFLSIVLSRVDLRLNAIGVTPLVIQQDPEWDHDVLAQRVVVQWERRTDKTERIDKRLARLGGDEEPRGKFAGWTQLYEGPDGSLYPEGFPVATDE